MSAEGWVPAGRWELGQPLASSLRGDPGISEFEGPREDGEHPPAQQPTYQRAMLSLSCDYLRYLSQIQLAPGAVCSGSDPEFVAQANDLIVTHPDVNVCGDAFSGHAAQAGRVTS